MKTQHGFLNTKVLTTLVLGIVLLAGGAYFFMQQNTSAQIASKNQTNQVSQNNNVTTAVNVPELQSVPTSQEILIKKDSHSDNLYINVGGKIYVENCNSLGVCGYVVLLDADVLTFRQLVLSGGNGSTPREGASSYAKDKNRAYYGNSGINNSDPATFSSMAFEYARDKSSIYFQNRAISTDLKNFKILSQEWADSIFSYDEYAKDTQHVYFHGTVITEADVATFAIVALDHYDNRGHGNYVKDKNHIYFNPWGTYEIKVIPELNPSAFTP